MPAGGVNILGIALLTALAGSVGGILLFDVSDFAEKALNSEAASISKVPLDDNTKLTLQAALVLLGFVVVAVGEPQTYACCCQLQSCLSVCAAHAACHCCTWGPYSCSLPADQLLAHLAGHIRLIVLVGARTVLSKVAGRVTKSTLNVVKLGFFWVLVFWAAKFIAES